MEKDSLKTKTVICVGVLLFISVFIWQLYIPTTLDDWRWGSEVGIDRLKTWFDGYNGRYFGNLVVLTMTRLPRIARALFASSIMLGVVFFVSSFQKNNTVSVVLSAIFTLFIPHCFMSQTYGWTSGFSNFVVGTFMMLLILKVYTLFIQKKSKFHWCHIFVWGLGFLASLILENMSLYFVILGLVFMVLYYLDNRKISISVVGLWIASILGMMWMYSNSAYGFWGKSEVAKQVDYKSIKPFSLSVDWFLYALNRYATEIVPRWLEPNRIIFFCISCLIICLLWKKKGIIQMGMKGCTLLFAGYFLFDYVMPTWKTNIRGGLKIQAVGLTVFCLLLVTATIIMDIHHDIKRIAVIVLLSQPILMAPFFIADPLSYRCFYPNYILFVVYLIILVQEIYNNYIQVSSKALFVLSTILIFGILKYSLAYRNVYQQLEDRQDYIKQEVEKGETEIHLEQVVNGYEYLYGFNVYNKDWVGRYKMYYNIPMKTKLVFPKNEKSNQMT